MTDYEIFVKLDECKRYSVCKTGLNNPARAYQVDAWIVLPGDPLSTHYVGCGPDLLTAYNVIVASWERDLHWRGIFNEEEVANE